MRFTTASHAATVGNNVPGATTESNSDREQRRTRRRARASSPGPRSRRGTRRRASRGSEPSFDTPPSSHSVMPSTVWPWRRATIECASSWARIDAKKSSDREHRGREVGAVRVRRERGELAARERAHEQDADHEQAPVDARPRCRRSGRGEWSGAWLSLPSGVLSARTTPRSAHPSHPPPAAWDLAERSLGGGAGDACGRTHPSLWAPRLQTGF